MVLFVYAYAIQMNYIYMKTAAYSLRLDPSIKAAAEKAADRDHRSLANFIEFLILNHCKSVGIDPLECGSGKRVEKGSVHGKNQKK